jgi:hypothetical protein
VTTFRRAFRTNQQVNTPTAPRHRRKFGLKNQEVVIGSCAWLDRTCGELEFAAAGEGEEHPVVPIVVFEAAG